LECWLGFLGKTDVGRFAPSRERLKGGGVGGKVCCGGGAAIMNTIYGLKI
jgi:hypothetical protein